MTPDRPFRRILAPVDDSACAQRALVHALSFAHAFRGGVHLLHVVERPEIEALYQKAEVPSAFAEMEEGASRYLAALAKEGCARHVPVQHHTRCAPSATEAILQEAEAREVDLIVLGTQGGSVQARYEMGSTAAKIVRGASCPVLTVGPTAGRVPEFAQRILVPIDFSTHARRALQLAESVARRLDAELLLVHVVAPWVEPPSLSGGEAKQVHTVPAALDRVKEKLDAWAREQEIAVRYRVQVASDRPPDGICTLARRHDVHLIVQGAGSGDTPLGSVAAEVVRWGRCSVITVPARATESLEGAPRMSTRAASNQTEL